MVISVHQPQYIPWLGYFDKINKSDCFVFLDRVQYKAREYQNRNKICTKDGWIWLTVPVISKGLGRQRICDVKVDNDTDWQQKHLRSLKSCYSRTPFFKEHYHFFENIYSAKWERLIELNAHIIKYILKELKIETPLYYESKMDISLQGTDRVIEICRKLKARTYLSGIGGGDYLEEEKFVKAGIKLKYQNFTHPVYNQLYMEGEKDFIPYLSIIDLIFNHGPDSLNILTGRSK